jgi:hypothetical protein
MGLEGLVSKHRDRPFRGGRQKFWVKLRWSASFDDRRQPMNRIGRTTIYAMLVIVVLLLIWQFLGSL